MLFYSSDKPLEGQVLVGNILLEKEEETCIYVKIPEYDNIEGLISKSYLPKKKRVYNKVLAQMRRDKKILCVVKSKPEVDTDGKLWPLDLMLVTIDDTLKEKLTDRYENIIRILKLVKFLSEDTDTNISHMMRGLYDEVKEIFITDFSDEDKIGSISDLSNFYNKLISDNKYLINILDGDKDLTEDSKNKISSVMRDSVVVKKEDCVLPFVFRINNARDANSIDILNKSFDHFMSEFPTISVYYKGAPLYSMSIPDTDEVDIVEKVENIKKCFSDHIRDNYQSCSYDLSFDLDKAEIKKPIYTMTYNRLISL
jgi:translation initiation factor 2 alpha subunit (eIF-2alpha)